MNVERGHARPSPAAIATSPAQTGEIREAVIILSCSADGRKARRIAANAIASGANPIPRGTAAGATTIAMPAAAPFARDGQYPDEKACKDCRMATRFIRAQRGQPSSNDCFLRLSRPRLRPPLFRKFRYWHHASDLPDVSNLIEMQRPDFPISLTTAATARRSKSKARCRVLGAGSMISATMAKCA
ncbi:hypothetical protein [Bradyrhizobium sp. STM 3809]|uniref:hypothetical protein n=1 Tax=Bradyrhizobium sp. STM 3809 TaxID=551936 RepID=UPI0011121BCE|nr:hypothetical protein [Bradyrhizobium sp. STM 3809]